MTERELRGEGRGVRKKEELQKRRVINEGEIKETKGARIKDERESDS